jgi:transposase-like protein
MFIPKGQRRFGGFDHKIIAMYAQGMTVREIQRFLEEQYKVEVSADLISTVTDSVMGDVLEWQNRPLEPMYAVVFFDALRLKIRDEGSVKNKAVSMMYPKTAAQSRCKFFRAKPGRCGALKRMRTVRAPSCFTTRLGSL